MYGFIETELAQIFVDEGLIPTFEPYATSDGTTIAIIDVHVFSIVKQTLINIVDQFGYNINDIAVVPSDVAGMRTILHPFWFNDELFDSITPGNVKELDLYIRIRQHALGERFSREIFLTSFRHQISEGFATVTAQDNDDTELDEIREVVIEPAPVTMAEPTATIIADEPPEIPPEQDESVDFIHILAGSLGVALNTIELENGEKVYCHKNSCILNSHIYNIARKTGKHIIVSNSKSLTLKNYLKTASEKIKDKIIVLHITPSHPKLYPPPMRMNHSLFGYDFTGLHQLHGGIDLNETHNPNKPHPLGPVFSEFDYVYRDYKTGVIWAIQKKCEIFFTFDITSCNSLLTEIVTNEFADRYHGALSHEEMVKRDIQYFEKSAQNDKKEFIRLAITNSKSLLEELKSKYIQAKESYLEFMGKAMEYAKISQRLEDNILSIDEEKLASEEETRCLKMYEDVMTIPKVSAVKVSGSDVNVYTKNIYVMNEKTKKFHDIGTFHIVIGMYGTTYDTSSTVRMYNTKHQVHAFHETMQAPHVFEDGHLCHGNIAGAMIDAYKRRDLYQMVLMLIMFLENVNLDDPAGVYLSRWPIVTGEAAQCCEIKDEFAKIFDEQTEQESKFDEMLDIPIHRR